VRRQVEKVIPPGTQMVYFKLSALHPQLMIPISTDGYVVPERQMSGAFVHPGGR
jgi:hypothetical protein